ncbi:hypothetical protein Tco_0951676 [Tanacetum coccineum]|uniref:Uncharacterized protein n=1 Tax=Tanacetum coccineum TaxID=301880 RepID=A0ABQ5DXM2_9ASTR
MEAYKKVHNETVRSELRMAVVQQSMEMDMWEIKEKLAERREQMAIRAYEEDKRHEELNQKIEEDKRREELNQKIEELKNLIQSCIQNFIWLRFMYHLLAVIKSDHGILGYVPD